MFKKLWQLKDPSPSLTLGVPTTEIERHSENRNIDLANLQLQKEALEKSLKLTTITVVVAVIGVTTSLVLGIVAVTSKQDVKVEQLYEQKTIQKTD